MKRRQAGIESLSFDARLKVLNQIERVDPQPKPKFISEPNRYFSIEYIQKDSPNARCRKCRKEFADKEIIMLKNDKFTEQLEEGRFTMFNWHSYHFQCSGVDGV